MALDISGCAAFGAQQADEPCKYIGLTNLPLIVLVLEIHVCSPYAPGSVHLYAAVVMSVISHVHEHDMHPTYHCAKYVVWTVTHILV